MLELSRSAPRWSLALLGSGEFEPWTDELERELLAGATGDGSVAIVATASASEGSAYHHWVEKGLAHYAVVAGVWPFILVNMAVLALIAYVPSISTALPKLLL